jgi:hypothetical protein
LAASPLAVTVGPNGETSLTIVASDTTLAGALVKIDITTSDTVSATAAVGLIGGESVTGTVTGVPTSVVAKTILANGGSMADTATQSAGKSDFSMIETAPSATGTAGTNVLGSTSAPTDWSKKVDSGTGLTTATNQDSTTGLAKDLAANIAVVTDGKVTMANSGVINMDKTKQLDVGVVTKSYYVSIIPRTGAQVLDMGAYTFQFQLTDANGVVRATKTVKIDWVSSAVKADGVITLTQTGTFLAGQALNSYDSATATAHIALSLKNRDNGLIRLGSGAAPAPSARLIWTRTGATASDTGTITVSDAGGYGVDYGTASALSPGLGSLRASDGIYGVTTTLPTVATSATAGANSYVLWAGYGNATVVEQALVVYANSGLGTASAANTDVLVTAAGMSAADQLVKTGATSAFAMPTTTKTATIKYTIQTSSDTNTPGALITVKPTWSSTVGTAQVTPATSTTGTVYTTDALGNFTVTVTYDAPISGATLSLVLSGGDAFGAGTHTTTLTWAKAAAATITIADPIAGISVLAGSTNVTSR